MNKKITVRFFKQNEGGEPVREWLQSLSIPDKKIVGHDIMVVEFSWPLGSPLVKYLASEIWEVRSQLTSSKIARVLFCIENNNMFLLHGFIKKTQKILKSDMDLAIKRKKQLGRIINE